MSVWSPTLTRREELLRVVPKVRTPGKDVAFVLAQLVPAATGHGPREGHTRVTSLAPEHARPAPAQPQATTTLSLLDAFELRCDGRVRRPSAERAAAARVRRSPRAPAAAGLRGGLSLDRRLRRARGREPALVALAPQPPRPPARRGDQHAPPPRARRRRRPAPSVPPRPAAARRHGGRRGARLGLEDALGGELLPDWYDDWLAVRARAFPPGQPPRARGARGAARPRPAASARALEAALLAVRASRCARARIASLIRVHLAEGNRGEALRQYELCRRLLRDRLDVEPSPAARRAARRLTDRFDARDDAAVTRVAEHAAPWWAPLRGEPTAVLVVAAWHEGAPPRVAARITYSLDVTRRGSRHGHRGRRRRDRDRRATLASPGGGNARRR